MEERYERGKTLDVLIVDYADILTAGHGYKESRFEFAKLYEELRILAGHFKIPVWTASQANRVSLSKPTIGMGEIAEAFGKANTADIVIGLCQTEEEKLEKEMRLVVAKNRLGETNPIVSVVCDLSRMVLRPSNEYDVEEHWAKPNLSKIRERTGGHKTNKKKLRSRVV
jgi:replicative DNA helicase